MLLSTEVWVFALIRRAQLAGAVATVVRKGDARAGAVLLKMRDPKTGATGLWTQASGLDGEGRWMQPVRSDLESDLDAYIDRAARIDSDLWVVEVEASDGMRLLTEKVDET